MQMLRTDGSDGGPAFPITSGPQVHAPGMSKRDWFAGQALAGEMATWQEADAAKYAEQIASRCYAVADAMLKAGEA